jgi:heptosyltransferase-3
MQYAEKNMRNALLFRWGGLGDLLVTFPAVYLIRRSFPGARLTLVCREAYGQFLREVGVVDEVIGGESRRLLPLFAGPAGPGSELREWLRGFDLIVGWLNKKSDGVLERTVRGASAPGRSHFFYFQSGKAQPMSRFFFSQTLAIIRKRRPVSFSFEDCARLPFPPPGDRTPEPEALEQAAKYVVVHPGSGGEKKRWPLRNFLEVIRRLAQRGIRGALVTGEAEERLEAKIERAALPKGWIWLRSPRLTALSKILRDADLYLGNDSGITHLAAACGTEVVALFRRELVPDWRPFGRTRVLSAASLEDISVDSVWEALPF